MSQEAPNVIGLVTPRVWKWNQVWPELKMLYAHFGQPQDSQPNYLPLEGGT